MQSTARSTSPSHDTPAADAFATLRRNSRPRRWLLAAAFGAILGWVGGRLLGSWIAIVLIACAVTVGLLIWDNRTGIVTRWRPGDRGHTDLLVAAVELEKAGWHVLIRPAVPGRIFRPDLLLVGHGGIVVVARQAWGLTDRVRTDADSQTSVGGQPASDRVCDVRASAAKVHHILTDRHRDDIDVHPVLAVHGLTWANQREVLPRTVLDVTILPIGQLVDRLTRSHPALSTAEAAHLAGSARQLFDPHTKHPS